MAGAAMMDVNPTAFARPIRIHGADDAHAAVSAAAALGVPVVLASAPGAGLHAGAPWFQEVVATARSRVPGVAIVAVLDCADCPGAAQAALASGMDHILFTGPAPTAARLADIAATRGAMVLTTLSTALDLRGRGDAVAACTQWLATRPA